MQRLKQIGTICFAIFFVLFPAFATDPDISVNDTGTGMCVYDVLDTYSGSAGLKARWEANNINIHWYSDGELLDVQDAADSCDYGGGLTVPSTPPTKTGYTFNGWTIRGLPDGYTRLQYVHFNGVSSTGSYIDTGLVYNTNIPNTQIRFQADAKIYQGTDWQVIVGGIGSYSGYVGTNASNLLYYGFGFNDTSTGVTNPYHRLFWDADAVAGTLKVQDKDTGRQIVNKTFTAVSKTNALKILIGGFTSSTGNSMRNERSNMDLYAIKIYKQNKLMFDGIPAKRNSDSVVGIYDTVSKTFKTVPSGKTALTAGPAVQ